MNEIQKLIEIYENLDGLNSQSIRLKLKEVIEELKNYQSKENKWIPVSERLPETDNEHTHKFDVLCYVPKVDGIFQHGIYIGKLKFTKGDYDGSKNFWGIKTKDCEWTLWGWSYFEHPTVVAWQPLPGPYKENEGD